MALQHNVLANDSFEHFGEIADDVVQVEGLKLNILFPSESEQLAGQIGGAFGGVGDLSETLAVFLLEMTFVRQHQLSVAVNDGEEIVEIMGDASGELANRLHFLPDAIVP